MAAGQDATSLALTSLDPYGATIAHAGTASFATRVTYATGNGPIRVTAADVNGDGKADLLVANNGSSTVSVLLGNGDGTFRTKTSHAMGDIPVSAAAADFNGDGAPDIVTVSGCEQDRGLGRKRVGAAASPAEERERAAIPGGDPRRPSRWRCDSRAPREGCRDAGPPRG